MSRREFRPKRWEQKANVRPGKRARMYRYTQYDVDVSYERGIIRGTMDTAERHRRRDDLLHRLAEAAERGGEHLEQLAEELDAEEERKAEEWRRWFAEASDDAPSADDRYAQGYADGLHRALAASPDDLTDVAEAAGVLDGAEDRALWDSVEAADSGESVVVEIEQWLRDRDRWIENMREHGDLPDED